MLRKIHLVLLAAAMVFALFMIGCGDEDSVTPTQSGTLVVACTPESQAIPWILDFPGGLSAVGNSDSTFSELETGQYTISWGAVEGWSKVGPVYSTQSLTTGSTITFSCNYTQNGSVTIDPTPEDFDAPWNLSGPNGYTQDGTGATTLTDMMTGDYSLTWETVVGFIAPSPATGTLDEDGSVTFSGTYVDDTGLGTIEIYQSPDGFAGTVWVLQGPQEESGVGNLTLTDMPVGEYSVIWREVEGFISPASPPLVLVSGETIVFNGLYGKDQTYVQVPPASVSIPATFTMGSTLETEIDETEHEVTLTGRFDMAATEVTNGQYVAALQWAYDEGHVTVSDANVLDALDGSTAELLDLESSHCQINFSDGVFSTSYPDRPVVEVSWYGAVAFCDWRSLQEGLERAYDHNTWSCNSDNPYDATGYRLPTEAEWEFASRAGTTTHFSTGDCLESGIEANFYGSAAYLGCSRGSFISRTADAGSYLASNWGLLDMYGNVFEWCNDWYGVYGGDEDDPEGVASGDSRVLRGGYWSSNGSRCRSAARSSSFPYEMNDYYGFRTVKSFN